MSVLVAAAMLAAAQQPVIVTPTAPPAPPSPPMVTTPVLSRYVSSAERLAQPPVSLEIRVSGEDGAIWEGRLRVGPTGASISQNRSEAQPANCQVPSQFLDRSVRTGFTLNLSPGYGEAADLYSVNVSWTRVAANGCAHDGTRTVQMQSTVTVPEHSSTVLRGDAGLVVELRRRS
jgi:hypothetical protein